MDSEAWAAVSVSTITASFRKAGLIECTAECDAEAEPSSDSETDECYEAMLPSEVAQLFDSASEDEAFDGFE